jgi:hypothetical protein
MCALGPVFVLGVQTQTLVGIDLLRAIIRFRKKKDQPNGETGNTLPLQTRVRMTDEQFAERMRLSGKDGSQIAAALHLRNEPKDAKFRRLANRRLQRAIGAIVALKTLANGSQYDYSDMQVNELVNQLQSRSVFFRV